MRIYTFVVVLLVSLSAVFAGMWWVAFWEIDLPQPAGMWLVLLALPQLVSIVAVTVVLRRGYREASFGWLPSVGLALILFIGNAVYFAIPVIGAAFLMLATAGAVTVWRGFSPARTNTASR